MDRMKEFLKEVNKVKSLDDLLSRLDKLVDVEKDMVFVSDFSNNKVLYSTKALNKTFQGDLKGCYCYDFFYGFSQSCLNCYKRTFFEDNDKTFIIEEENKKAGIVYNVINKLIKCADGAYLNIALFRDNDSKLSQNKTSVFNKFTNSILALAADHSDYEKGIELTLKSFMDVTKAERVSIFEINKQTRSMSNTICLHKNEIAKGYDKSKGLLLNSLPWFTSTILLKQNIFVKKGESFPKEAKIEEKYFAKQGIDSLLAIPIIIDDVVYGILLLSNLIDITAWNSNELYEFNVRVEEFCKVIGNKIKQKKMEEDLIKMREFLFETGIIKGSIDLDTMETKVDDKLWEMLGRKPAPIISSKDSIIYEPDKSLVSFIISEIKKNSEINTSVQIRLVAGDNTLRWYELKIYFSDKASLFKTSIIDFMLIDIHQQKVFEMNLMSSNTALNISLMSLGLDIFQYDIETHTITVINSSSFSTIHNINIQEFLSKHVNPEDQEELEKALDDVKYKDTEDNIIFSLELRLFIDYEYRWHELLAYSYEKNKDGSLANILIASHDIHKEILRSRELSERQNKFNSISSSVNEIIFETDESRKFTLINRKGLEILGFNNPDEINLYDIIHPNDAIRIKQILDELINIPTEEQFKKKTNMRINTEKLGYRWYEFSFLVGAAEGKLISLLAVGYDTTEHLAEKRASNYALNHDKLTGVYNNYYLLDYLEQEQEKVGLNKVFVYINVDNFRRINEVFGYKAGNDVIVKLAQRLDRFVDNRGILARISGDEFAIVMDTDGDKEIITADIKEMAQQFKYIPITVGGQEITFTITCGISFYPDNSKNLRELLLFSETVMLNGKKKNRGTVISFNQKNYEKIQHTKQVVADVKKANIKREFTMHYQPIVNLNNDDDFAVEALIRWNHPIRGILTPAHFIDIIENSRQIVQIDKVIFVRVLAQIDKWLRNTGKRVSVSYNVSAACLANDDYAMFVIDAISRSNVDFAQIQLEITETIALDVNEIVKTNIKLLRCQGIKIALDDFGMEYSTLSQLDSIEFDTLKVDKHFVDNIDKPITLAILKMIREISSISDFKCIVEGVETVEQYNKIIKLGFENIQGYYFYRPVSASAIQKIILDNLESNRA